MFAEKKQRNYWNAKGVYVKISVIVITIAFM